MLTPGDLVEQVQPRVIGTRIVALVAVVGPLPGITLVLEDDREQRGELTLQAGVQASLQGASLTAQATISVSMSEFKA